MSEFIESKTGVKPEAPNGKPAAAPATPSFTVINSAPAAEKNVLVPSGAWPPPIYLEYTATAQERFYMEHRWHSQWEWYDKRATFFKKRHQRIQLAIVISAGLIPPLVAISPANPDTALIVRWATIALSVMVTVLTGWETVYKHGDNWRNFRAAAEDLAREKSMYDMRAGPYRKAKNPFMRFVERTEDIVAKQNGNWLNQQTTQPDDPQQEKSEKSKPDDDLG